MSRRNPATEFKNKHLNRQNLTEQNEKGFFTGLMQTPITTSSKIESRTDLNKSQQSGFHPFFNTDRPDKKKENQTIRHSSNSSKFIDLHTSESLVEHNDFAKRLIYQNRTIGHNYTRLHNEYYRDEEYMKSLKASVVELRKRYEGITCNLKPCVEKIQSSQVIQVPTMRINPSLTRKNTNALVKIAELKFNRIESNKQKECNNQNQSLQVLRAKLECEKRESDNLMKKNEKLGNMVKQLQQKKRNSFSAYEYMTNMARLEGENKDLHNIIRAMSEVLSSDRRMGQTFIPDTNEGVH